MECIPAHFTSSVVITLQSAKQELRNLKDQTLPESGTKTPLLDKFSETYLEAVDESTDRTSISQLLVFVRGIDINFCVTIELLGMFPMKEQTTGIELLSSLILLCHAASLNMNNCVNITTDGAKSMIGTKIGMVTLLKERLGLPIVGNALKHRHIKEFLKDFDDLPSDILYYTEVRWLSQGVALKRFMELFDEIVTFLSDW
ncbi:general transcription factor II-I repeat domain-containing protein 2A [Trichonephila inaurata madagascariensis]|uniref:General transcription factor II-I repeat domain-containing protein 2A n=1 Tax=Trichonephila inaurata madagascariensis TaxID=2747483 RepID=A0A8X6X8L9_9ARAC|nr:general transcription factor II-I repeat domain-containing protein 2A [Trichonephila inaurata madagascariensis]